MGMTTIYGNRDEAKAMADIHRAIQLVTQERLRNYMLQDTVGVLLERVSLDGDESLTAQRWLSQSPPKRLIYEWLYGDLLTDGARRRRVLDVGGGLLALTRELAKAHDYTLLDLLAHDSPHKAASMERDVGRPLVIQSDWFAYDCPGVYDVVIANDLFPNVDQRLELFLQRFISKAKTIRLSLTFYNLPRFYLARRLDADEVVCMLAWDGPLTRETLKPFVGDAGPEFCSVFDVAGTSVYPNGRQVCLLELAGHPPSRAPEGS